MLHLQSLNSTDSDTCDTMIWMIMICIMIFGSQNWMMAKITNTIKNIFKKSQEGASSHL